jgi:septum formation topological specificity factor MinE
MFAFNTLQKTLEPFIIDKIPQECIESIRKIADKHKDVLVFIDEFYRTCASHVEFLQTAVQSVQKTILQYGVDYSQAGITQARLTLVPVLEKFRQQSEKTDQLAHAILYLIMEYINDSPLNTGISLQKAPTIAVLSVNVFVVGFASSLVAMAGVHKALLGVNNVGNDLQDQKLN